MFGKTESIFAKVGPLCSGFLIGIVLCTLLSISTSFLLPQLDKSSWQKTDGKDNGWIRDSKGYVKLANPADKVAIGTELPLTVATESVSVKNSHLPRGLYYLSCAKSSSTRKIYCFGGYDGARYSKQIIEYDPAGDTIVRKVSSLPSGRNGLACVESSGTHNKIYCFGGFDGRPLNQVVEYNPLDDSIRVKSATLPTGRHGLACAENSATHKIYCLGGYPAVDLIVEYDPVNDLILSKEGALPQRTFYLACAENSATHKIYCFGGHTSLGNLDGIIEYDPANDLVAIKAATLPSARRNLACTENSATHKIYCFGGFDGINNFSEIIEYDPQIDAVSTKTATLPLGRQNLSCTEGFDAHKIYCFGGSNGQEHFSQILEYSLGTVSIDNILTIKQNSDTDPIADSWLSYSSKRWKTNISPINGALEKVTKLRGVEFNWIQTGKRDIGMIAEEVGKIFPELVSYEDSSKTYATGLDYARLTAVLVEAIKQLNVNYEHLRKENTKLREELEELKSYLKENQH